MKIFNLSQTVSLFLLYRVPILFLLIILFNNIFDLETFLPNIITLEEFFPILLTIGGFEFGIFEVIKSEVLPIKGASSHDSMIGITKQCSFIGRRIFNHNFIGIIFHLF